MKLAATLFPRQACPGLRSQSHAEKNLDTARRASIQSGHFPEVNCTDQPPNETSLVFGSGYQCGLRYVRRPRGPSCSSNPRSRLRWSWLPIFGLCAAACG